MKKRIITAIIILLLITFGSTFICLKVEGETPLTKDELQTKIEDCQFVKDNAATMAASARNLGWTDEDTLIQELKTKWHASDEQQAEYQRQIAAIEEKEAEAARAEEAKWASKASEYPAATTIWRAMKAQGWNDYVCAGIMGNLMAEVGGQTLNIQYTLCHDGYYGMCQWNKAYGAVWGASLEGQIDFLINTIKYEFDTYGSNYAKGFNFNSFLNLQDCRAASLAFSKAYERCASYTYSVRQSNAVKAYNYFVD